MISVQLSYLIISIPETAESTRAGVANFQGTPSVILFFAVVDIPSTSEHAKKVDEGKELDHLLRALGGNRLPLRSLCMKGTRQTILQEIEDKVKSSDGPNIYLDQGISWCWEICLGSRYFGSTRGPRSTCNIIPF